MCESKTTQEQQIRERALSVANFVSTRHELHIMSEVDPDTMTSAEKAKAFNAELPHLEAEVAQQILRLAQRFAAYIADGTTLDEQALTEILNSEGKAS